MNCLQVREKVTEYAVGTLRGPDAQEVERHLEWCAGCRKEAAELQEGAAAVALALPEAEPPAHLEREIVERIATAAGRRKPRSRRGFWALAAATLSAMLVAVSAFGWALAERSRVTDLQVAVGQKSDQLQELQRLIDNVPNVQEAGRSLQAELRPLLRSGGFGRAVLFAASEGGGWIVVDVVPPEPAKGRAWREACSSRRTAATGSTTRRRARASPRPTRSPSATYRAAPSLSEP